MSHNGQLLGIFNSIKKRSPPDLRRFISMRKLLASLLFVVAAGAGCSAAYADQPGGAVQVAMVGPRIAIASANEKVRAPYDVQVIRENGETLSTYAQKDRFYVQGNANERYIIRVTNPTANRVEAVVSVDGLDVVDGEGGDLRKRGYVIQPYGEVRIEGFRTSQSDVATFRFSSVTDSYAGKKGKARNVGVIAAAIFEEAPQVQQQIVAPEGPRDPNHYNYEDDLDGELGASLHGRGGGEGQISRADRPRPLPLKKAERRDYGADSKDKAPAPPPTSVTASRPSGGAPMPTRNFRPPADDEGEAPPVVSEQAPRSRPGLGTEFGESRNSAATFTRFVRAPGAPVAIAELRYNDTAGLMALGIPVQPLPDSGEIMTRETADPFPGDRGFARAPR